MSCDSFLERLHALLDGSLAESASDEALAHLEECADCRALAGTVAAASEATEDADLSAAILARTTGATCGSAGARLCARLDGELDDVDLDLVERHLRGCPDCDGLARGLALVQEELPTFAALDPGPRFTEGVLARTSRRQQRVPLGARIAAGFERLLDRRRIALEGAFVATFALAVPVLAPGSPLTELPGKARSTFGEIRGEIRDLEATVVAELREAWADAGASVAQRSRAVPETIRRTLGTFRGSAASGQKSDGSQTQADPASEKKQ